MIANVAREDFEDMKADGLAPTLDDFDRMNCLALRMEKGAETTCANAPAIGWAGPVPFYKPTCQSLAWYFNFAERTTDDGETQNTLYYFACAHARVPHFFDDLTDPDAIGKAVKAWVDKLPVTREEIVRACNFAACGFDLARGGKSPLALEAEKRDPRTEGERALANLREKMDQALVLLGVTFEELWIETPSHLDALIYRYHIEAGEQMKDRDAKLACDYKFAVMEIRKRLTAERDARTKGGANG